MYRMLTLLSSALLLFGAAPAPEKAKPNCLFILVDQQRQDGVGAYVSDSKVETPHLDAMAAGGILFNRAYTAQPVCAPNRGSIFSGLYPFNHGVLTNTGEAGGRNFDDSSMLATWLHDAGYRTGFFGNYTNEYTQRWHAGEPRSFRLAGMTFAPSCTADRFLTFAR